MSVAHQERVHRLLTEAIAAVRGHEIPRARLLLSEVLKDDPRNEHALLWVAAIADDAREGKQILQRVLDINPANDQAKHALKCLRERTGELPIPVAPALGAPAPARNTHVIAPEPRESHSHMMDSGTWRRVLRDEVVPAGPDEDAPPACPFCAGRLDAENLRCVRCRAICSFDNLNLFSKDLEVETPLIERCVGTWMDVAKYRPTPQLHRSVALGCMNLSRSADGYTHLIESLLLDQNQADIRRAVDLLKCRPLVLVVDHSATARKLVSGLLDKHEYLVKTASNAAEALAWIEDVTPDLIYMDLAVPDMPGTDLVRDLRSRPELTRVPILAVSHIHGFVDRMKVKMAGASGFLYKPFQSPELLKEVEKLARPRNLRNEKQSNETAATPIDQRLHR